MEQRLQLVRDYRSGFFTMTELAEQYGISRKTGYKWVDRYVAADADVGTLSDRSRRPHNSPSAVEGAVVDALIALRRRHPRWGPKKLLTLGRKQHPPWAWPSRSTTSAILKRAGLVTREPRPRRRTHQQAVLAPITTANGTWTTDFKGEFRTGDGRYCYPLTLRDGWSRFVLRCDGLLARTFVEVQRRFARAFAEYGLPERIRSDNGLPFAGIGLSRLSRLAVWWMRLGIVPERIVPGHPEQNGSHEQFHAVLKAATARPPAPNLRAQQRRFDRFCTEYNHERPHEALDHQVPADRYQPSPRRFPAVLAPLEYPGHLEVRLVSGSGEIAWRSGQEFLSETLAGEYVGFEEVDDGIWTVYFATIAVARFDERYRCFHPIAAITEGRSAASSAEQPHSLDRRQAPARSASKNGRQR
jgi:transposase InsO family protein